MGLIEQEVSQERWIDIPEEVREIYKLWRPAPMFRAHQGELSGIISVQDFMGVVFERELMDLVVVKELATTKVITAHADEDLDQTMRKIGQRDHQRLADRRGTKLRVWWKLLEGRLNHNLQQ